MDPFVKKLYHTSGSAPHSIFSKQCRLSWPDLEYMDLADPFDRVATGDIRKYLHWIAMIAPDRMKYTKKCFYNMKRISLDDCRALVQKVGHKSYGLSIASFLSETSWTRREIFLSYLKNVVRRQLGFLESGRNAEQFLNIVRRCGFPQWSNTAFLQDPPTSESIFPLIYPSILIGLCKMGSKHLVVDFIKMMCTSSATVLMLFAKVPDQDHLEFMLDAANEMKFDFWGARAGIKGRFFSHIIRAFVKRKGYDLVTTLIRYGFTLERMSKLPGQYNITYVTPSTHPETTTLKEREATQSFLWLLAVGHMNGRKWVAEQGFCDMYRTLVLSLPHPRESLVVVRERFVHCFKSIPVDWERNIAAFMASPMFPESRVPGEPVKLSEMCRCVIRERLRDNFQLPQGVCKMEIPTFFKKFCNFEDTDGLEEEASSSQEEP